MPEEIFEVIDEAGNVVGLEKRAVVHAKGLRHKEIYLPVFVREAKFSCSKGLKTRILCLCCGI